MVFRPKNKLLLIIPALFLISGLFVYSTNKEELKPDNNLIQEVLDNSTNEGGPEESLHPLTIEVLRQGEYPGSEIIIEQTLTPGLNYKRYIASYKSEGLKIYGLLTIPNPLADSAGSPQAKSEQVTEKYPAIIFNHGYISPSVYKTTEKYVAYQDAFASAGYVTFKSDYRGHGNSEGDAQGGYGNNDYTIDVLNAVSSIKKYPGVDPERIGMWGHSMGGSITLKTMVVNNDIKAGVIWAGVVGSYPDLIERWRRRSLTPRPTRHNHRRWREELTELYGNVKENPEFWASISVNSYLSDISGPLQLHHGTNDSSVPLEFSESLEKQMQDAGKPVELFIYEGDDHNLSRNLSLALNRSVRYFDTYLKNN